MLTRQYSLTTMEQLSQTLQHLACLVPLLIEKSSSPCYHQEHFEETECPGPGVAGAVRFEKFWSPPAP